MRKGKLLSVEWSGCDRPSLLISSNTLLLLTCPQMMCDNGFFLIQRCCSAHPRVQLRPPANQFNKLCSHALCTLICTFQRVMKMHCLPSVWRCFIGFTSKKMQFVGKAVLLQKVLEKYTFFLCSLRSDCICAAILQRTWERHVASVLPLHEPHYFLVAERVTLTTNLKKEK